MNVLLEFFHHFSTSLLVNVVCMLICVTGPYSWAVGVEMWYSGRVVGSGHSNGSLQSLFGVTQNRRQNASCRSWPPSSWVLIPVSHSEILSKKKEQQNYTLYLCNGVRFTQIRHYSASNGLLFRSWQHKFGPITPLAWPLFGCNVQHRESSMDNRTRYIIKKQLQLSSCSCTRSSEFYKPFHQYFFLFNFNDLKLPNGKSIIQDSDRNMTWNPFGYYN